MNLKAMLQKVRPLAWRASLLVASAMALTATQAEAAPITWNWAFTAGNGYTGTITTAFDSSALSADLSSSPSYGAYRVTTGTATLNLVRAGENFTYTEANNLILTIINDLTFSDGSSIDAITLDVEFPALQPESNFPLGYASSVPTFRGFNIDTVLSTTTFSSDEMPSNLFLNGPLSGDLLVYPVSPYGGVYGRTLLSRVNVSSIEVGNAVPEPATLSLLCSGFLGLFRLRKKARVGRRPMPILA